MADTIIGANISIEGDISGSEAITILGSVRGRVDVKNSVHVGTGGRVEADIESQSVEVAGFIQGNVTASDKIDIKSGGRVVGDVKAPRVLIADGAAFKGNINMQG